MPVKNVKTLAQTVKPVKYGSAEHKTLVGAGYRMTVEEAETIIRERKADHSSWPFEKLEQAQAMLTAIKTKPRVVSTTKAWQRRIMKA
jgi:hypothetical protein